MSPKQYYRSTYIISPIEALDISRTRKTIRKERAFHNGGRKLFCREMWELDFPQRIAGSLKILVQQPDASSFFVNRFHASDVFIGHTVPQHRYGSTNARSRRMIEAPGAGGTLQLRQPTVCQIIAPLGVEASMCSTSILQQTPHPRLLLRCAPHTKIRQRQEA